MPGADDRQAVLRLCIADRVAARERPARLANLGGGTLEDGRERVPWQLLGERRDRQGEQDPTPHREHVVESVGCGDLAEGPGVVDERRKEVERADDREVVGDAIGGRVVGRRQAGDQIIRRGRDARPDAEPGQRVGQQVRAQLGRAATAVSQLGQADRRQGLKCAHDADHRRGALKRGLTAETACGVQGATAETAFVAQA